MFCDETWDTLTVCVRVSFSGCPYLCCIADLTTESSHSAPARIHFWGGEMWFTVIIYTNNPYSESSSKLNHNSPYSPLCARAKCLWWNTNPCFEHSTRFVLSQFPSKTAFIIPQLIAFGVTWKWIGSNTVIFVRFTPGIIRKSLSHFAKFNLSSYYVIWFVWKFGSPFITLSTRHFMANCKVIPMKTNENSFACSFHCWTHACFGECQMRIWSTLYWEEMGTWRK